jgi:protein gp37
MTQIEWTDITRDGRCYARQADLPEDTPCRLMERVGKRAAGRELDGRTHDAMPPHGGTRAHV